MIDPVGARWSPGETVIESLATTQSFFDTGRFGGGKRMWEFPYSRLLASSFTLLGAFLAFRSRVLGTFLSGASWEQSRIYCLLGTGHRGRQLSVWASSPAGTGRRLISELWVQVLAGSKQRPACLRWWWLAREDHTQTAGDNLTPMKQRE